MPAQGFVPPALTAALRKGVPPSLCVDALLPALEAWLAAQEAGKAGPFQAILGFRGDFKHIAADSFVAMIASELFRMFREPDPDAPGKWRGKAGFGNTVMRNVTDFARANIQFGLWILSKFGDMLMELAPLPGGENQHAVRTVLAQSAILSAVYKFTGVNLEFPGSAKQAVLNWLVPTLILDPSAAIDLFIRDMMPEDEALAHAKAGGQCPASFWHSVNLREGRLNDQEATELWLRGELTEHELRQALREQGVRDDDYAKQKQTLTEWWPGLGDVIHRATLFGANGDDRTALKLDTGAEIMLEQDWRDALTHLGISAPDIADAWAARFRPVDIEQAKEWYRRSTSGEPAFAGLFGEEDFQRALRQSLVPPAHRGAVVQSIYSPPPRRILSTLYTQGAITKERVKQALAYEGFNPDDAEAEAKVMDNARATWIQSRRHAWPAGKVASEYAAGRLNQADFEASLKAWGYSDQEITDALYEQNQIRRYDLQGTVIDATHKHYVGGKLDDASASSLLATVSIDASNVDYLLSIWRVERDIQAREEGASTLLSWWSDGLIDDGELMARLLRLKYTPDDARRIIAAYLIAQSAKNKAPTNNPDDKIYAQLQRKWETNLKDAKLVVDYADKAIGAEIGEIGKIMAEITQTVSTVRSKELQSANGALSWIKGRVNYLAHKLGLDPITLEQKKAKASAPTAAP